MRDALFLKIQRLGFSYFDRQETGQLLTRLTNDVDQVRLFISAGTSSDRISHEGIGPCPDMGG